MEPLTYYYKGRICHSREIPKAWVQRLHRDEKTGGIVGLEVHSVYCSKCNARLDRDYNLPEYCSECGQHNGQLIIEAEVPFPHKPSLAELTERIEKLEALVETLRTDKSIETEEADHASL